MRGFATYGILKRGAVPSIRQLTVSNTHYFPVCKFAWSQTELNCPRCFGGGYTGPRSHIIIYNNTQKATFTSIASRGIHQEFKAIYQHFAQQLFFLPR